MDFIVHPKAMSHGSGGYLSRLEGTGEHFAFVDDFFLCRGVFAMVCMFACQLTLAINNIFWFVQSDMYAVCMHGGHIMMADGIKQREDVYKDISLILNFPEIFFSA